jgi:hypothetical protein
MLEHILLVLMHIVYAEVCSVQPIEKNKVNLNCRSLASFMRNCRVNIATVLNLPAMRQESCRSAVFIQLGTGDL